jgi:hypothetical protein
MEILLRVSMLTQSPGFSISDGSKTLSVRFIIPERYGFGANLVSKAPPRGGPDTGIKQIFFKDNRIHYSIDGLGTLNSKSEVVTASGIMLL